MINIKQTFLSVNVTFFQDPQNRSDHRFFSSSSKGTPKSVAVQLSHILCKVTLIVLRRRDTKESSVFDKMLPVDDNEVTLNFYSVLIRH